MIEGGGENNASVRAPAVFISYASQDAAVADAVVGALEHAGLPCWIAPRNVAPGSLYADEIVGAINDATVVVLVLSEHAIASPHVGKEIERASSKRRPIIALHTDSAPLTRGFEYFLSESQWIEVGQGGVSAAAAKLVEAVRRHLDSRAGAEPRVRADTVSRSRAPTASRSRSILAGGVVVLSLALSYLVIDKFWLSRHVGNHTPVVAVIPAASPSLPATQTISEKSVAVLPFVDMSEKKDQEYFSDGLAEELIDRLTKIPDLRVPARTSSFYFKSKSEDVPTIARRLMVAFVLEGSVRKLGTHLRVTAQLVRADNGYHLWSETYDRNLDDIFKVQDEIAASVVTALRVSLLEGGVPRARPTTSTDAYTLYLQAQAIRNHALQSADAERAIDYLQRALKLDPKFARAWAALASYRVANYADYTSGSYKNVVAEARLAAEQALKLDPNLSEAHYAMSAVYELERNWKAQEAEVNRVLVLDPGSTLALWAAWGLKLTEGRFEDAVQLAQKAVALDPLVADHYSSLALTYLASGRFGEAETTYREALDLAPTQSQLHFLLGWTLLARRELAAALAEMQQETDASYRDVGLALAFDALGRKSDADRALAIAEAKYARVVEYPIAAVYANRNDLDKAFAWLDRAYQVHDGALAWLPRDPLMKNLRNDRRYAAFLRKATLSQ